MAALFRKLNRHARRTVYFSTLVGGSFHQPQIDRLLARSKTPFPDYIYAVNILYQMGLDAELSFVDTPGRLAGCTELEDFLNRMKESYGELNAGEIRKLTAFFRANHTEFDNSAYAMKWALLRWSI